MTDVAVGFGDENSLGVLVDVELVLRLLHAATILEELLKRLTALDDERV